MSRPSGSASGSAAPSRPRRADAERNIEAILAATADLLASGRDTNMSAIASAAGVGRVTLYGHFGSRREVLEALLERAVASAADALGAQLTDDTLAPREALRALLRSSWQILDRHRSLYAAVSVELPAPVVRAHHDVVMAPVERLLARGRDHGDFRSDVPLSWLVATLYSLLHLAAEELNAGRLEADRVGDVLESTVIQALSPPTDASR